MIYLTAGQFSVSWARIEEAGAGGAVVVLLPVRKGGTWVIQLEQDGEPVCQLSTTREPSKPREFVQVQSAIATLERLAEDSGLVDPTVEVRFG
jgi:hypothetical protein